MREITNAEINMAAANILELLSPSIAEDGSGKVTGDVCYLKSRFNPRVWGSFDIFAIDEHGEPTAEAAKCILSVVIALGEKHGIYLYPHFDVMMGYFRCWNVRGSCTHQTEYDTYIEALSAAVQAVK